MITKHPRAHLKQTLTIEMPDAVMEHVRFSQDTVISASGFMGGGVEVYDPKSAAIGVLVYFPAVLLKDIRRQ